MNFVEESINQSIIYLENAIDVWNELKERFSHGDFIRISELQIEIHALKQGNRSVSEFFTALKILWEELEAYLSTPICNCPRKCVCATGISNVKTQHDLLRKIRFLTGLNDNFDMVRSQILLMDPLPPINKVFSSILQHERQFVPHNAGLDVEDSKVLVNASDNRRSQGRGKGGFNGQSGPFKKKYCTYCGKDNHVIENCFKKHGFPPNFGRNNASANHFGTDDSMDNDDIKSLKASEPFTFTKSQYEHLVNLLQSHDGSSTQVNDASTSNSVNTFGHPKSGIPNLAYSCHNSIHTTWIIDSGASDHICSTLALFDDIDHHHDIVPIQVKMPNGTIAFAKKAGSVTLGLDFTIDDVLLVPDFSLNLLYVLEIVS
ncbi:uncharacterized protein LOC123913341 [Trifolium pratense]|uniref:uncharacterized protein LOC123913341 n=1 Tax=Trifolium pratense TaxID=57577 RepID=UPI001E695A5A|nr:uncharacterized protein LOC123913341 [Trifolium pratense]